MMNETLTTRYNDSSGLTCAYKPEDCNNSTCFIEKKCKLKEYCVAVFDYEENGKFIVRLANCFYESIGCKNNNDDICTAQSDINLKVCCCKKSMCNTNFSIVNKTQTIISTSTVSSTRRPINGTETTILVAGIILFLLFVILGVILLRKCSKNAKLKLQRAQLLNLNNQQQQQQQVLQTAPPLDRQYERNENLYVSPEQQPLINQFPLQAMPPQSHPPPLPQPQSHPVIDLNNVNLLEQIAHSQLSTVWRGNFNKDLPDLNIKQNELCAVKVFQYSQNQLWSNEKDIYLYLNNYEYVLKFYGTGVYEKETLNQNCLLIEYQNNGSLCDYLKLNQLSWQQICNFSLSILNGLAYLHSEIIKANVVIKPTIAHRDFKSKNILVKENGTCCIVDFGYGLAIKSGRLNNSDIKSQVGTRRYMSPELLEGAITFSKDTLLRIDVYACALVLWELISRGNFYDGSAISQSYELPYEKELGPNPSVDEMIRYVVNNNNRPKINPEWLNQNGMRDLVQTINDCWDSDVEARLSSECAASRIRRIINNTI